MTRQRIFWGCALVGAAALSFLIFERFEADDPQTRDERHGKPIAAVPEGTGGTTPADAPRVRAPSGESAEIIEPLAFGLATAEIAHTEESDAIEPLPLPTPERRRMPYADEKAPGNGFTEVVAWLARHLDGFAFKPEGRDGQEECDDGPEQPAPRTEPVVPNDYRLVEIPVSRPHMPPAD